MMRTLRHRSFIAATRAALRDGAPHALVVSVRLQSRTSRPPSSSSSSSSSSPSSAPALPAAPPEGRLMPAFSPDMYGYHRGARGAVEEPMDVWLALLSDAVPFYKDSLVMVSRRWTRERQTALWRRAQEHLPGAHLGLLPENRVTATASSASAAVPKRVTDGRRAADAASTDVSSATAMALIADQETWPATAPTLSPPTRAPLAGALDRAPPQSLDLIVLASNLFGEEMLFHAPWYVSMAHRALKPHGVLALFGHTPHLTVAAPAWAGEDVADYMAQLRHDAHEAVTQLRQRLSQLSSAPQGGASHEVEDSDAQRSLTRAKQLLTRLEQALEIDHSESEGHQDVYLPFRGVQRRWFTAEYAMTPAQLATFIRAMPLYQLLHDPVLAEWLHEGTSLRSSMPDAASQAAGGEGGAASMDFVDEVVMTALVEDLVATASGATRTDAHDADDVHVRRQRETVDGLEVLESYLHARLGQEANVRDRAAPQHRRAPRPLPPLRVQLRFFVVTCSGRSMNSTGSFDSFDSSALTDVKRLPASRRSKNTGA